MLLPIHPQPYPEELLTSWMVRLALENGWHLHTFYKVILRYQKPIWNRDTDKYCHPNLIERLSAATGISTERIQQLSIQSYNGVLFQGNPRAANLRWILPLGIYHRRRKLLGLQFCPLCLAEQPKSYYRKYWRVAFYGVCHKHKIQLLDMCPQCQNPIEFHRIGVGSKNESLPKTDLSSCHSCNFDLRLSSTKSISFISPEVVKPYLNTLSQFVTRKENFYNKHIAIPLSLYDGLRYIGKMLLHPYSHKFRLFFLQKFTDLPLTDLDLKPRTTYENQTIDTRLHISLMSFWLASEWPKRFSDACQQGLLFRSAISDDFLKYNLPYWLVNEIQQQLPNRTYILSDEEILQAILHLKKNNEQTTVSSLAKIMGIGKDSAANYYAKAKLLKLI